MRIHSRIVLGLLFSAVVGCGKNSSPPTSSTPNPAPDPPPPSTESDVSGTVHDSAFRALAGAKVEVVDGPSAGRWVLTGATGGYSLRGEFDDTTRFRATAGGHVAAVATRLPYCERCRPNWWLHFSLAPDAPTVDLSGDYRLTIRAASTCTDFPADSRQRTYIAAVARVTSDLGGHPAHTMFEVTLGGGSFVGRSNVFRLFVAGNFVSTEFGNAHGAPGPIEEVGPQTYFTVAGGIATTVTDVTAIRTSLVGVVERCELQTPWGTRYNCSESPRGPLAQCSSDKHEIILTRQ